MQARTAIRLLSSAILSLLLLGCASTEEIMRTNADPLEPYNRVMFQVNDGIDRAVLTPLARGYMFIAPQPVRTGVGNFFGNLEDVVTVANDLLQLKFHQALEDTTRVVYNTSFGLVGLFDVATPMGLPKNNEDFAQTLGYWGVGEGYFLVLPLLGPSTTRDVWGIYPDRFLDPLQLDAVGLADSARFSLAALELVDTRASILEAQDRLGEPLDPYAFQRDAYLQLRRNLVFDGNPPQPSFDLDDLEEEMDPPAAD